MKVAILLPSKGRAKQLQERVEALLSQTYPKDVDVSVIVAAIESDKATIAAANALSRDWGAVYIALRPEETTAVQGWNIAYMHQVAKLSDWLVLGADDIVWHPGWLESALATAVKTKAQVIGLHDGHTNLSHYGAHYMVSSEFCSARLGDVFIPPHYASWWFDREVCEKAAGLKLYAPDYNAVAEHIHPDWKKAPMDATYEAAWPLHDLDREVYDKRKAAGFPVDYPPLSQLTPDPVKKTVPNKMRKATANK